jgi:hypothetical protein
MAMKKQLFITFTLSVILSVSYALYHAHARSFITLSLHLSAYTTLKRPILQLFFDIGQGFREDDSHKFLLFPQNTSQKLVYTIQRKVIYGLRLDYLNGPGSVLLHDMRFLSTSGDEILSISIPENVNANQTFIFHPTPGTVALISTPSANDPFVYIPFSEPFLSPAGDFDPAQVYFGIKTFCALFVGISLILILTGNWFAKIQKRIS